MNVPEVTVRYLPADRLNIGAHWLVLRCPFCHKRHTHGADSPRYNVPARDSLGLRHSHCVQGGQYELVPDMLHFDTVHALEPRP